MLNSERVITRDYRNSRIGDFLKEMDLTEGRSTGIPKMRFFMKRNGSPEPVFQTDEDLNYFLVTLFHHPGAMVKEPVEQVTPQVNEGVNEGVNDLFSLITKTSGKRAPYFAQNMNTSVKNIERWLKHLKDDEKIEFRGAPKTGGYFVK